MAADKRVPMTEETRKRLYRLKGPEKTYDEAVSELIDYYEEDHDSL